MPTNNTNPAPTPYVSRFVKGTKSRPDRFEIRTSIDGIGAPVALVMLIDADEAAATQAFIVTACNAHDTLTRALALIATETPYLSAAEALHECRTLASAALHNVGAK